MSKKSNMAQISIIIGIGILVLLSWFLVPKEEEYRPQKYTRPRKENATATISDSMVIIKPSGKKLKLKKEREISEGEESCDSTGSCCC